jgi:hypothetical protein
MHLDASFKYSRPTRGVSAQAGLSWAPLLCFGRGEATLSRQAWLLLGKQIAKDILSPLPALEALVRISDHGLHACLGLLTTRFPNGCDG